MGKDAAPLQLLALPDIVLEKILSYLPYDEISKNRLVCKTFDGACKKQLNRGLKLMEKCCIEQLNTVKSQLPRRESERMNHPLKPHYNVLAHMKAKISVLSHTYKDYMDLNLGCFIPGKVIDEAFRVLRCLKAVKIIPYYNEILQEFLDISSMAIEHFREEITRDIEEQCLNRADSYESLELSNDDSLKIVSSLPAEFNLEKFDRTIKRIDNRLRKNHRSVISMKGQLTEVKWKMNRQSSKMKRQSSKMREYVEKIDGFDVNIQKYIDEIQNQDLTLQENAKKVKSQNLKLQRCAKKIQDQEVQIADIVKHVDFLSQKLRSLNCPVDETPEQRET